MKARWRQFWTTLFLLCLLGSFALAGEEKKSCTPPEKIAHMSMQEAAELAKEKLGKPPRITKKEIKALKSGKPVIREGNQSDTERSYQMIALLDAPPSRLMTLMKDYGSRKGNMPFLDDTEVSWFGHIARVTQHLSLLGFKVQYTVLMAHYGDYAVEWVYDCGDLADTHGYYRFFPFESGDKTLLVHSQSTRIDFPMPQTIMDAFAIRTMKGELEHLKAAIGD